MTPSIQNDLGGRVHLERKNYTVEKSNPPLRTVGVQVGIRNTIRVLIVCDRVGVTPGGPIRSRNPFEQKRNPSGTVCKTRTHKLQNYRHDMFRCTLPFPYVGKHIYCQYCLLHIWSNTTDSSSLSRVDHFISPSLPLSPEIDT